MEVNEMSIYLDNAATTRVCPAAADAAMEAMTLIYANPSAPHRMGREAKALLENARRDVALGLGCAAEELYFTSGGTEGDNWAILRGAEYNRRHGTHVISSAAEHPAVLKTLEHLEGRGFSVTLLRPDKQGRIAPEAVEAALREDTCLVSLMLVNNETGAVSDLAEISRSVRAKNPHTLLHTDAVQAFLKLPFSPAGLGVDLLTVSAHKVHAPKGAGALYVRKGLKLPPLLHGGGQEGGHRSGTEATPAIAGFAAAVREALPPLEKDRERMRALRDAAAQRLAQENPGLLVLSPADAAPQLLSISLPGWRSEVLMNY
ncbi:MAG: cysteine desulfurase, partial [Oscillospiraceae bacterium]|nr:cysteine desulfurase [Oscillospiraceae bacterium]